MSKASEYLKVAAAQLRRAAQTRQAEISELRREIDRKENDKRSKISDLRRIETQKSHQMSSAENDLIRARMAQEISQLRNTESQVEKEVEQIKSHLSQQIASGERQTMAWSQQASQLEQSASFQ